MFGEFNDRTELDSGDSKISGKWVVEVFLKLLKKLIKKLKKIAHNLSTSK
jgi:hypothetical protein